ncbi:M48 family metallopeptidase [Propionivibrio dicarboxylicus]|uniref:YgjP-like metallopeptidase domain-containing protein n=1 Tax=Propionivibrio dicarboxylicus TaxID=83767 RepID=A0A1G8KBY6_9RHOO|nr:SprT family zinc-dependent metalloprotease [Propionivibrio dicarboxylicus]SDI40922.1 hypothetical protein SAMN05660652_03376 [Propionivibrio dicarboxylicus]
MSPLSGQTELPFGDRTPLAENEVARTIALGDRIVPYVLRRSRRRSIGLQIDHRGLRIAAPVRASLVDVEALIRKHGDWVAQKLDAWRSRRRAEPLSISDGVQLPLLGETLTIRTAPGNNRFVWHDGENGSPPGLTLQLRAPTDAGRVLERALRERALTLFPSRLAEYARRLELPTPPLALSSARTRWGSCSRATGIRLNWRLVHFPLHIVDYVVAHELAHLLEMNHSRRFWAHVATLYPDYRAARAELNALAATCPQWQR